MNECAISDSINKSGMNTYIHTNVRMTIVAPELPPPPSPVSQITSSKSRTKYFHHASTERKGENERENQR